MNLDEQVQEVTGCEVEVLFRTTSPFRRLLSTRNDALSLSVFGLP